MKIKLILLISFVMISVKTLAQYDKSTTKKIKNITEAIKNKDIETFKKIYPKLYVDDKIKYNLDYNNNDILGFLVDNGLPYFVEFILNNGYKIKRNKIYIDPFDVKGKISFNQLAINRAWDIKKAIDGLDKYEQELKNDFESYTEETSVHDDILLKKTKALKFVPKNYPNLIKVDSLFSTYFFDYCKSLSPNIGYKKLQIFFQLKNKYPPYIKENDKLLLALFKEKGIFIYEKLIEQKEITVNRIPVNLLGLEQLIEFLNFNINTKWLSYSKFIKDDKIEKHFANEREKLLIPYSQVFSENFDKKFTEVLDSKETLEELKTKLKAVKNTNSPEILKSRIIEIAKKYFTNFQYLNFETNKNYAELYSEFIKLSNEEPNLAYQMIKANAKKKYGFFLNTLDMDEAKRFDDSYSFLRRVYNGQLKKENSDIFYIKSRIEKYDRMYLASFIYRYMLKKSYECPNSELFKKNTMIYRDVCVEVTNTKENGMVIRSTCSEWGKEATGILTSKKLYGAYLKQKPNSLTGLANFLKFISDDKGNTIDYAERIGRFNDNAELLVETLFKLNDCNSKAM